jgi:hypothetical protein
LFQWEEQGALPLKSFSGSNPHLSVFFSVCHSASKERRKSSERTKWALVMLEFAPICIYLVISPLVSLIPLGVPFPFASNSLTYPEKLSDVVSIPPVMPEVVSIYNFIHFLFYLLSLIRKSPFLFLGQYLLTRLICLDLGP